MRHTDSARRWCYPLSMSSLIVTLVFITIAKNEILRDGADARLQIWSFFPTQTHRGRSEIGRVFKIWVLDFSQKVSVVSLYLTSTTFSLQSNGNTQLIVSWRIELVGNAVFQEAYMVRSDRKVPQRKRVGYMKMHVHLVLCYRRQKTCLTFCARVLS